MRIVKVKEIDDYINFLSLIKEINLSKFSLKSLAKSELFLFYNNNTLVGCGGIKKITDNTGEIVKIVVKKKHRKKGYGKKIIKYLEKIGFKKYKKLILNVNDENSPMKYLLHTLDYIKEGYLKNHYKNGRNIIIYAKYKNK